MQAITTIGLDIAKNVFQVHGIDAEGKAIVRQQLRRSRVLAFFKKLSPCVVGIEACASSHYWSRELQALGHTVKLMPPAYVKPYVKRQKNDAACGQVRRKVAAPERGTLVPLKGWRPSELGADAAHRGMVRISQTANPRKIGLAASFKSELDLRASALEEAEHQSEHQRPS